MLSAPAELRPAPSRSLLSLSPASAIDRSRGVLPQVPLASLYAARFTLAFYVQTIRLLEPFVTIVISRFLGDRKATDNARCSCMRCCDASVAFPPYTMLAILVSTIGKSMCGAVVRVLRQGPPCGRPSASVSVNGGEKIKRITQPLPSCACALLYRSVPHRLRERNSVGRLPFHAGGDLVRSLLVFDFGTDGFSAAFSNFSRIGSLHARVWVFLCCSGLLLALGGAVADGAATVIYAKLPKGVSSKAAFWLYVHCYRTRA